jgi:hypothetical protein
MVPSVEQPNVTVPVSKIETRATQKLEEAFEIMDQIPSRDSTMENTETTQFQRIGFHWKISLEAVLPDDVQTDSQQPPSVPNRSTVMDIGFTIPFLWGWSMVDDMTKSFLKNFKPYKIPNLF